MLSALSCVISRYSTDLISADSHSHTSGSSIIGRICTSFQTISCKINFVQSIEGFSGFGLVLGDFVLKKTVHGKPHEKYFKVINN